MIQRQILHYKRHIKQDVNVKQKEVQECASKSEERNVRRQKKN